MNADTYWIVLGTQGEYSDRRTWGVAACVDGGEAQQLAERLTRAAKEATESQPEDFDPWEVGDPACVAWWDNYCDAEHEDNAAGWMAARWRLDPRVKLALHRDPPTYEAVEVPAASALAARFHPVDPS